MKAVHKFIEPVRRDIVVLLMSLKPIPTSNDPTDLGEKYDSKICDRVVMARAPKNGRGKFPPLPPALSAFSPGVGGGEWGM